MTIALILISVAMLMLYSYAFYCILTISDKVKEIENKVQFITWTIEATMSKEDSGE